VVLLFEAIPAWGRLGISFQDVAKAITKLQSQQKNPTVDNIREVLGTGSKSTIARFLREWKTQNGLQHDDDGRLPPDLLAMVKDLWGRLQEKADNQTSEYQRESDAKIMQLQQELNQHKQLQSEWQLKIHALEEQFHQKTEENNQLKTMLFTEQQAKVIMVNRAALLESRQNEGRAENERLHQLLKHVQENLEHYQSATQQQRQEQSLLIEKQRGEYEQKLSQLQKQSDALAAEKSHYQAQYNQLNKVHEASEAEQKALVLQQKEIQQQYESLKIVHDRISQEHARLSQQLQDQAANLEAKQHAAIEFQFKLKADTDKIRSLEDALSKANDKVDALRHDNQFISQEKANLEGQMKQLQAVLSGKKATLV
jgi:chromosome segregation ATPase